MKLMKYFLHTNKTRFKIITAAYNTLEENTEKIVYIYILSPKYLKLMILA